MPIVDAPQVDRLTRAGVVTLAIAVFVVAVLTATSAAGLPGYEAVAVLLPVTAVTVWLVVGRRSLRELLATHGSLRWAALAVLVAGVIQAAVTGAMLLAGATAAEDAGGLWWGLFAGVVIGGLFDALPEEVAFRGVLLRGLHSAWGRASAVAVTSVLFVASHVPRLLSKDQGLHPVHLASLLLFGASMAALAIASGSIWPAVGWHVGVNGVGGFLSAGLGLRFEGPTWLVGASGYEGVVGVAEAVLQLVAALGLAALLASRRRTAGAGSRWSGEGRHPR